MSSMIPQAFVRTRIQPMLEPTSPIALLSLAVRNGRVVLNSPMSDMCRRRQPGKPRCAGMLSTKFARSSTDLEPRKKQSPPWCARPARPLAAHVAIAVGTFLTYFVLW